MLNFLNMFTPYKPGWTEKAQRVWWCQAYRYSRKIRILSNKVASGTFCAKNKHGFRFLCSTLFRSTNGAIEGFYRWLSMDVGKNPTWSEKKENWYHPLSKYPRGGQNLFWCAEGLSIIWKSSDCLSIWVYFFQNIPFNEHKWHRRTTLYDSS